MRKQWKRSTIWKVGRFLTKTDIPVKIVKENIDIVSYFLYHSFSNSLSCSTFPTGMQYAEVTPNHKKGNETDKKKLSPNKYFA